jgi:hypothetical protein
MGFSFGNLSAYTDELSFELISKAVLQTDLMSEISVRTGLQAGTVAINLLDGTLEVGNLTCGWNPLGTASLSQVDLCVRDKQVKMDLCPQDLRTYYTSELMRGGAHQESIPFEQTIADYYVSRIRKYNEEFLISGDGTCNGIKQQVATASGATLTATASWTTSSALSLAQDMFDAVAEEVKDRDDLILVLSPARYNILVRALVAANYYHYDSVQGRTIAEIPGTTMRAIRAGGLVGSNYMCAGPAEFIVAGTGLTDDMSQIRFFYDQGQDVVKLLAKWRIGVAVHQVNLFATNGLA